jgi:large subunit ribosomal protein L13
MFKTPSAKPRDHIAKWILIDAKDQVLGRLASKIAIKLRGKERADFTPYVDLSDNLVVINVEKIIFTGKKLDQKIYRRYSNRPGNLKIIKLRDLMNKNPAEVLFKAVKGMMPKNSLSSHILTKLKLYVGSKHPHIAQQPQLEQ